MPNKYLTTIYCDFVKTCDESKVFLVKVNYYLTKSISSSTNKFKYVRFNIVHIRVFILNEKQINKLSTSSR